MNDNFTDLVSDLVTGSAWCWTGIAFVIQFSRNLNNTNDNHYILTLVSLLVTVILTLTIANRNTEDNYKGE